MTRSFPLAVAAALLAPPAAAQRQLPRSLVARVDGTLDYVPAPANGAGDHWIAGVQVGVAYRLGR